MEEIVPGAIVFGGADPDVEVGGDPGAGCDRVQVVDVVVASNGFGDGDGFESRRGLQGVVEAPQAVTARLGIIFPCVLAVENDGDDRIFATAEKRLGGFLNVLYEALSSLIGGDAGG